MSTQIFEILGALPGLNEIVAAARNAHGYNALKKRAQHTIAYEVRRAKIRPVTTCRIAFLWYSKDQKRDLDNIRAGAKFILDALVECEIVKNDTQRYITGLADGFAVDASNPRVVVSIMDDGGVNV